MAHPFARHNESDAGKARAKHLMKGYARGGKAHGDEAEDRALFKKMMKQHEKEEMKPDGRASGGRLDRKPRFAEGGGVTAKSNKTTKKEVEPQQIDPGEFNFAKSSEADKAAALGTTIRKSSGMREHYARGGKTKRHNKGTNVNIAIVNPAAKDKAPVPALPMPPPGLPAGGPPPVLPPPKPPMGGPPGGLPPGMMPPMKRGGRTYAKGGKVPMTAGADSGEGRLQKIKAYGKRAKG